MFGKLEFPSINLVLTLRFCSIINLLFVNSSHERIILPEVARVLSLLPNVNTLQISITFSIFRDYFTEYSYPQIHTVYLYGDLLSDNILGACPNLRRFFHSSISRRHRFPPVLPTCTTQIEELGVLSASRHGGSPLLSGLARLPVHHRNFSNHIIFLAVIRQFPHLREVSVDFNLLRLEQVTSCFVQFILHTQTEAFQDDFEQISLLALQTLRLYFGRWKPPSYGPAVLPTSDERDKWISMAKKVLKSCPSREGDSSKRILMVINEDRSLETYPVFAYRVSPTRIFFIFSAQQFVYRIDVAQKLG